MQNIGGGGPREIVQILEVATELSDDILLVRRSGIVLDWGSAASCDTLTHGLAWRDHFLVTLQAGGANSRKRLNHAKYSCFHVAKVPVKKLLRMKLFARFYVFIYEARAKLYVAKKDHDHKFHKATASSRRPSEPYIGATRGTPPAARFRRAVASGSSAPGLF